MRIERRTQDVINFIVATITIDETEIYHASNVEHSYMLGNIWACRHVIHPINSTMKKRETKLVKMENGSRSIIPQKRNFTIEDEVSNEVLLKSRVVAEDASPQRAISTDYNKAINQKCKVTSNASALPIIGRSQSDQ